jgi:excisionase family DNA binding protein
MTQSTDINDPAQQLLQIILSELRSAVRQEFALLRQDLKQSINTCPTSPRTNRFYSVKEVAVELNLSKVTVHRLIKRGLLRPNRTTRHLRIPRDQVDEFSRNGV